MEGYCIRVAVVFCLLVIATARDVPVPFGCGRSLVEASNNSTFTATSDRTIRIDPLDNFHKYREGYNITNKHYWSSVIFTGIYGYAIGVLWLIGAVIYGGFLVIESRCSRKQKNYKKELKRFPCSRICYLWPSAIAILLTLLAIAAAGIALGGSSRFHSRANTVKRIVSDTADDTVETIHNVTSAVGAIEEAITEHDGVMVLEVSPAQLNSTSRKLEEEAYGIRDEAYKYVRIIGKGLRALQATTVVLVSLTVLVITSLLCVRFLKLRRPFQVLLTICWLLGFFLWMFFGLYVFLDRFAGDTCVALEDYRQEPGNSSLSTILPCSNQQYANSALRNTKAGISYLIDQVNANISATPGLTSLTNLGLICNPFSNPPEYEYQPDLCPKNSTKIGDIPLVLQRFACTGSGCGDGEFIPATIYAAISAFTTSIQQLIDALPGVEDLVSCKLVEDAFYEILLHHCRPLKRGVKIAWIAMASMASLVALLAALWAAMHRHDSKCHPSSVGSVGPHLAGRDQQEVEANST